MREGKGEPATPGVVHSIKGPVNSGKIYYVETGDDGVTRIRLHRKSIQKKDSGHAFAKHLQAEHPDQQGDHEAFDIKVEKVFQKPLERQVMEGPKEKENSWTEELTLPEWSSTFFKIWC